MGKDSSLKSYLVEKRLLSEEDIYRAEDYALTMNIGLDQALVFLKLLDYHQLGQALAEIHQTPYTSLLPSPPSPSAMEKLPLKVAERHTIFPVGYDPAKRLLTLAVSDPQDHSLLETLEKALPQPLEIRLVVASTPEILTAIDVHYKGKPYQPESEVELPEEFKIIDDDQGAPQTLSLEGGPREIKRVLLLEPDTKRSRAIRALLETEGFQVVGWAGTPTELKEMSARTQAHEIMVNAQAFRPQGSWVEEMEIDSDSPIISFYDTKAMFMGQHLSYPQMSELLISLVAFIMKKALRAERRSLEQVIKRVKYCKLLALRVGLSPVQTDALLLASWLSGSRLGAKILRSLDTPYNLEEILKKDHNRMESILFNLVTSYQALERQWLEKVKDIQWLRKRLLSRAPDSSKGKMVVEKFLGLLRDEEFLARLESGYGRILMVDPQFSEDSTLVLRLTNHGFEVIGASDASEAARLVAEGKVDLVISEVSLPGTDGIKLLKAIKKNRNTSKIPFFFLTDEKDGGLAAKCLEAGADEFFTRPVDFDLLRLKIQRALSSREEQKGRGVSGSLADMNAMDIIQSVATGYKDVEIRLEGNGQRGRIYVQRGEIVHAELGTEAGEMAFYKLVALQEGRFQILPCSVFPERTVHGSTMSLLMEGARQVDEMAA